MAIMHDEVRSLLKDVALEGVKVISKRKLLWLLGWLQDRPGAWEALLGEWVEIGQDRSGLGGTEMWDKIILTADATVQIVRVDTWV